MLYSETDQVVQLTENEVVIYTPDVESRFASLVESGMREIVKPKADAAFGKKAFVQDSMGVLIELRAKEPTL